MKAQIRPNRLDISDRFPLASFTIRTDGQPRKAEIVVATSPDLFNSSEGRNRNTFFSTREQGVLSLPRAEAVYTLPPEVLSRFTDADRLWFGLATAPAGSGDSGWQVDVSPTESSPYISLAGLTDTSLRRVRMFPRRTAQSGYGNGQSEPRLTWAGDAAQPGMRQAGGQPQTPASTPAAPQPAANGGAANGATPPTIDIPYDDGFGPLPSDNGGDTATVPPPVPAPAMPADTTSGAQSYYSAAPASMMGGGFDGQRALRWIREKVEAAVDAVGSDVSGPSVHHLSAEESEWAIQAWRLVNLTNPGLRAIPGLARETNVTLSIGPVLGTPLFGAGVGIVFAPNGRVGLFGQGDINVDLAGLTEFAKSLKAVLHGSIKLGYNSGGIAGFESIRKVAGITVGEEIVAGAELWLDGNGRGIGGAASIGVGFALQFAAPSTTAFGTSQYSTSLSGGWTGARVLQAIETAITRGAQAIASDVNPPAMYELGEYSDEFILAWRAAFLFNMPALSGIPALARQSGKTISVGPMLDTPLFGAGVGVLFAPDGKVALFGRGDFSFDAEGIAEFIVSLRAVLSASFKVGCNNGGIAGFRNIAKAASLSGGAEIVLGAEAWLDRSGNIVGGAVKIGVGFAVQFSAQTGEAMEAPSAVAMGGGWTAERILERIQSAVEAGVRAAADDVNPPRLYELGDLSRPFITAWTAAYFLTMPAFAAIPRLARESGKTLSIGPILDTPLFGAGVGVVFTPDGKAALFGRGDFNLDLEGIAEFISSLKATLAASVKIGFNNGGIAGFRSIAKAAGISEGAELVLGAEVWLNSSDAIVGGAISIGAGFSIQLSAGTASAMSAGANELREHAKKIGGTFEQRVDDLLGVSYPKDKIGDMLDALDNRRGASAQALGNEIPLDPGVGGMSILPSALEIGDIIVSTTSAAVSRGIRFGSGSEVSHAMLYVGQGGQVIEAIGDGVVLRPLSQALNDATLAVAFRVPGLSSTKRQQIADAAAQYIGRPYGYEGVVRWGLYHMDDSACSLLPGSAQQRCRDWAGRINLGPGTQDEFFCSQLVLQAYEDAGHRLTTRPAHWSSPEDVARLRLKDRKIAYVGHLRTPEPRRTFFGHSFGADGMPDAGNRQTRLPVSLAQSAASDFWDFLAGRTVGDAVNEAVEERQSETANYSVSGEPRPARFSNIRRMPDSLKFALMAAMSPGVGALFGAARLLDIDAGYSIAIGVGANIGASIGATFGAGIILGSNGDLGVYGLEEVDVGEIFSASATLQITVMKGGIDAFNGAAHVVSVSGGEGYVGGLTVIYNDRGQFVGVTLEGGIGIGSPVSFYVGVQRSVSQTISVGQSVAMSGGQSRTINWDDVQQIAQPNGMGCWATAAAMLEGWKNRQSVDPTLIARYTGYEPQLTAGLLPADKIGFARAVGLTVHPNACRTPEDFFEILENYGPVWVTANVVAPRRFIHAIVATGMYNDGGEWFVRITDPLDRVVGTPGNPGARTSPPTHTTGSRYIMRWEDFAAEYEAAGNVDRIQLLHTNGTHGHTPNRGSSTPQGYALSEGAAPPEAPIPAPSPAPAPAAYGAAPEAHEFGPGVTVTRQVLDKGQRRYELAQLKGFVQPQTGYQAAVDPQRATPIQLNDWPYIDGPNGRTQAGIAIDWAYQGGAVGNVGITPLDGTSPDGWSVQVLADALPGQESPGKAQVKVEVVTIFTKDGEEEQVAVSVVMLNGDGQHTIQHDAGAHSAEPAPPSATPSASPEPVQA